MSKAGVTTRVSKAESLEPPRRNHLGSPETQMACLSITACWVDSRARVPVAINTEGALCNNGPGLGPVAAYSLPRAKLR